MTQPQAATEYPALVTVAPMPADVGERAQEFLDLAASYEISCPEMRVAAGEDLKRVKAYAKQIEADRKAITDPLDLAKKRVMDLFRKPAEFLATAEATLKRACVAYDAEQERIRREQIAAAARRADEERARLNAEAAKQKAAGNTETAHAIAAAATMVSAVPVPDTAPKVAGESTRTLWSAEVVDLRALARAVADGVAPVDYLLPNQTALNALAVAQKETMNVPGVRAKSTKSLASRAA